MDSPGDTVSSYFSPYCHLKFFVAISNGDEYSLAAGMTPKHVTEQAPFLNTFFLTDIYSCGIVFWEILTCSIPFSHLGEDPPVEALRVAIQVKQILFQPIQFFYETNCNFCTSREVSGQRYLNYNPLMFMLQLLWLSLKIAGLLTQKR